MSRPIPQRVLDRIWDRIDRRGPDECWPWKLSVHANGYGQVGWSTSRTQNYTVGAHRAAWTAANGPIPEGMTVDHLCRNRRCCNPAHLRLLTHAENAANNAQSIRTMCPASHVYDDGNTYFDGRGHRRCRSCARLNLTKWRGKS